jgi:hypothetical protein
MEQNEDIKEINFNDLPYPKNILDEKAYKELEKLWFENYTILKGNKKYKLSKDNAGGYSLTKYENYN